MTDGAGQGSTTSPDVDVVVVGAGFGGLYSLYRLRERGYTSRVFERGDGVGGTWFWNRYPGARCDVESLEYSYSFSSELEQEWEWTERYPTQPEILRYINHVADRFDLRSGVDFETTVTSASWDDAEHLWTVTTDKGESVTARFLINAVGCLSTVNRPPFEGLDDFKGDWYHTAAWPHDSPDFAGKRVGVIGTGSTGIQAIPQLAKQADHLTVLQRTPNYSVPAQNGPMDPEFQKTLKARYQEHRQAARESAFGVPVEPNMKVAADFTPEEQKQELDGRWAFGGGAPMLLAFADMMVSEEANEVGAEYVRSKIREIVTDPEVAERLCPYDHPIGTKRICVDTGYYETYNRDNVELVSIRDAPIERLTPTGLRLADGQEFEFDAIVFAIGFDAMTGTLFNMNITGRDGLRLQDAWDGAPRTYLGLTVNQFPNMFVITGPGSPSVLSNMVVSIEQHVDFSLDCIDYTREQGATVVEATTEAQQEWVDHVAEVGNSTLFPRANSWYTGQNIPGRPKVFTPYVGGVGPYRETCNEIAAKGYEGFSFDGAPSSGDPEGDFAAQGGTTVTDTD